MRHTRTCVILLVVAALFLFVASPVLAQPKGGALMAEDVFTPIAKGYDLVRDGKYDAAKYEFETAVKRDRHNPFALNNLAVLEERSGKLNDALANLKDATTHAAEYKDKVVQTCFVGGGCLAVKPVRAAADKSEIAPIIAENIKKLEAKMAAQKTPAPAGSPPAMVPPPKTK
jgi:tetratricopeptide (TPR) repeat protein